MAILTRSGRTALATALLAQPIHLAWGSGDPAWDTAPVPEPATATALVAEVGRRALTEFKFVMREEDWLLENAGPVPDGKLLVVPTGRYVELEADEESNEVYVRFQFDYEDGATATIREVGVFVGTALVGGLPPGQLYFEPADVADPGKLLALQRDPKNERRANIRQSYEFVLEL